MLKYDIIIYEKYASNHDINEYMNEEIKCNNYKEHHYAWKHEYFKWIIESKKMKEIKVNISITFIKWEIKDSK